MLATYALDACSAGERGPISVEDIVHEDEVNLHSSLAPGATERMANGSFQNPI